MGEKMRITVLENDGNGLAKKTKDTEEEFINLDCEGWHDSIVTDGGMEFHVITAEPNAAFVPHKGPDTCIAYLSRGKAMLELTDDEGKLLEEVEYRAGDLMIFRPDTMHGWRNGPEETEFIVVMAVK